MSLEEILTSDDVVASIRNHMDEILTLIPELKPCIGFNHKHPHHHLDVWEHTLLALSLSPNDYLIRLTLLLHDIGKPFSFQEEDGIRHFRGHGEKSREISVPILNRLGYDDSFSEEVLHLIGDHDNPIEKEDILKDYDYCYKKYQIQRCDALAHHPDKLVKRKQYLENTKQLFKKI